MMCVTRKASPNLASPTGTAPRHMKTPTCYSIVLLQKSKEDESVDLQMKSVGIGFGHMRSTEWQNKILAMSLLAIAFF
jgi:hypothetical protein